MLNYGLPSSKNKNEKVNKTMNKTIYSFTRTQNKNIIPKLSLFECPLIDYEFKYTKINNKISNNNLNSFCKNHAKKKNLDKNANKKILYSLKHNNQNIKKKNDNNSFNILTFNYEICKQTNHNLKGKKISLSNYSLPLRNKLDKSLNRDKNLKSYSLFEKYNNNESSLYSFEGSFHNKIIYKKGDFFASKIEKDLIDILNKNKNNNNNNKDNEFYPKKFICINKNISPLVKYQNNSRIQYLENFGDSFLKENKMKLIKNKTSHKTLMEMMNKNIKINSINQSIKPKMMSREILYVDQNNKTINQNKALNLLNEEKNIINNYLYKYNNFRSYYLDDKGNGTNLPLLTQKENNINPQFNYDTKFSFDPTVKIITDLGQNKLNDNIDNYKDIHLSTSGEGKLGRLIKDRFTMNNYRNINISKMKNDSYVFRSGSHVSHFDPYDHFDNDYKNDEKTNENFNLIHRRYHNHIKDLIYKSPLHKKKKKKKEEEKLIEEMSRNNDNLLKDILGLIKSKIIIGSIQKKHKKRKARRFSCLENPIGNFNLANKLFGEDLINNSINTQFKVKDSNRKIIKIIFKKRKNSVLVPTNEKGEEIKDRRIINNLMNEARAKLNDDAQSKIFHKKLSFDKNEHFINPLTGEYEKSIEDSSLIEISNNVSNNNIEINKTNNEEKEKSKIGKKEKKKIGKKSKIKDKKKQKIKIHKSSKKKNISEMKKKENNDKGIDIKNAKEKRESEFIFDPKVKYLLSQIENEDKNNKDFYKEEDDFIKDFNFDFYSSEEDEEYILHKKMRQIRKRKNKFLFLIFNYIAKNKKFSKDFKKADLIKCLLNEEFKYNFRQLKDQIIKDRELAINSLLSNKKEDYKKVHVEDLEIINYLFHYIEDKNSLFYKAIYNPIRRKSVEIKDIEDYNKFNQILDGSKEEALKKGRRFSIYQYHPQKIFDEDKEYKTKKKFKIKKEKKGKNIHEFITENEKKLLLINEITLTNEIRYQISISNDKEIKEKFTNLLNKIESLRNLDSNEYVKSLKENYEMYKDEAMEILKAKEIEERLNGFIDSLNYERSNLKDKHKYIMSLLCIKDNKFLSILEKRLNGLK